MNLYSQSNESLAEMKMKSLWKHTIFIKIMPMIKPVNSKEESFSIDQ